MPLSSLLFADDSFKRTERERDSGRGKEEKRLRAMDFDEENAHAAIVVRFPRHCVGEGETKKEPPWGHWLLDGVKKNENGVEARKWCGCE